MRYLETIASKLIREFGRHGEQKISKGVFAYLTGVSHLSSSLSMPKFGCFWRSKISEQRDIWCWHALCLFFFPPYVLSLFPWRQKKKKKKQFAHCTSAQHVRQSYFSGSRVQENPVGLWWLCESVVMSWFNSLAQLLTTFWNFGFGVLKCGCLTQACLHPPLIESNDRVWEFSTFPSMLWSFTLLCTSTSCFMRSMRKDMFVTLETGHFRKTFSWSSLPFEVCCLQAALNRNREMWYLPKAKTNVTSNTHSPSLFSSQTPVQHNSLRTSLPQGNNTF